MPRWYGIAGGEDGSKWTRSHSSGSPLSGAGRRCPCRASGVDAPAPAPDFIERALGMPTTTGWAHSHPFLFADHRHHPLGWPPSLAPNGRRLIAPLVLQALPRGELTLRAQQIAALIERLKRETPPCTDAELRC